MIKVVEQASETTRHELFFISHDLMQKLASQSMRATGTVRGNRINSATKTMISHKKLKKRERGSFDYRCDGTVYVSKWSDNSIVYICSNYNTHLPVRKCERRVKGAARSRYNSASFLTDYNKEMAGVRFDGASPGFLQTNHSWKEVVLALVYKHVKHCSRSSMEIPLRHKQHKVIPR